MVLESGFKPQQRKNPFLFFYFSFFLQFLGQEEKRREESGSLLKAYLLFGLLLASSFVVPIMMWIQGWNPSSEITFFSFQCSFAGQWNRRVELKGTISPIWKVLGDERLQLKPSSKVSKSLYSLVVSKIFLYRPQFWNCLFAGRYGKWKE